MLDAMAARPDDLSSPASRLADPAAWRRLSSAEGPAEFCGAWLALFCAQFDLAFHPLTGRAVTVRQAFVALGDPEHNRYGRLATLNPGVEVDLILASTAERAMQVRRGLVQTGNGPGAPCQFAYPILADGKLLGVVAVETEPAAEHMELAMRLAQWGTAWFSRYYRPVQGDAGSAQAALQVEILRLCSAAAEPGVNAEAVATFVANRLGAQKLSLGLRRKLSAKLVAMSHGGFSKIMGDYQAVVIGAMDEAVDSGAAIQFPKDSDKAAHAKLCRDHNADWSQTVLHQGRWAPGEEASLIWTAEGTATPPERFAENLAAIAELVSPLLLIQLRSESSLKDRLTDLGRREWARLMVHGDWLRKACWGAGVLALAIIVFGKADYEVTAKATLEGTLRRSIVAPFDGYIADASVRPGDRVTEGAELGRLDDRDIKLQESDVEGKLAEAQRQVDEALGQRDNAKVNIYTARRDQAQAELNLLRYNLKRTSLTAPFDGYVVTGDKSQSIGAPVHRGDTLFEVSPTSGFRVDLDVPQTEFADLAPGQDGRITLSSLSSSVFTFKTERLSPVAVPRDGKTVFRVEATLLDADEFVHPGMQGIARVNVGRRHIFWIWTHPVWDWLRLKTWEWLP